MAFKRCSSCGHVWETREEFLNDHSLAIIGYQPDMLSSERDLFFFNHACKTTLGVPVAFFLDMYEGIVYSQDGFKSAACGGHCLKIGDFQGCGASCKRAHIRKIAIMIYEMMHGR